jgi:hypothetical protein
VGKLQLTQTFFATSRYCLLVQVGTSTQTLLDKTKPDLQAEQVEEDFDVHFKESAAQLAIGVQSQHLLMATSRKVAPVHLGTGAHWLLIKTKPALHLVQVDPAFDVQVKEPSAQLRTSVHSVHWLMALSRKVPGAQVGIFSHWLSFKKYPAAHLVQVDAALDLQVKEPVAQLAIGVQAQHMLNSVSRKVAPVQVGTFTHLLSFKT